MPECRRCWREGRIRTVKDPETCSICYGPLCGRCWDEHGRCGAWYCETTANLITLQGRVTVLEQKVHRLERVLKGRDDA